MKADFSLMMQRVLQFRVQILILSIGLSPLSLVYATTHSIEKETQLCQQAFDSAYHSGPTKNVNEDARRRTLLRQYEIEDEYLEEAKSNVFRKNILLKTYTVLTYFGVGTVAVAINGLLETAAPIAQNVDARNQNIQAAPGSMSPMAFVLPLAFLNVFANINPFSNINPRVYSAKIKNLFNVISSSYLLGSVFTKDFQAGIETLKQTGQDILSYPMVLLGLAKVPSEKLDAEVEIEAFQLKYNALKAKLPQSYRIKIEEILDYLQAEFVYSGSTMTVKMNVDVGNKEGEIKKLTKQLQKIEAIFSLPLELKPIKKVDYEDKLEQLLVNYDQDVQAKIRHLTAGIEASSQPDEEFDPFHKIGTPPTRRIIYLLGPPGTGKTYLGEKYADALGLPFLQLSAAELKELALGDRDKSRYDESPEVLKFTQKIVKLAKEKRKKNLIIFVDEFDKLIEPSSKSQSYYGASSVGDGELQGFFLQFFDRERSLFKLRDLDVDIDLSSITFLLAGNRKLTDSTNAMVARMRTIDFNPLPLDKRVDIACRMFGQKTRKLNLSQDPEMLTKDLAQIVALAHKDFAINLGVKALIKTIEDFADHIGERMRGSQESLDLIALLEHHSQSMWDAMSELANLKKKLKKNQNAMAPAIYEETLRRLDTLETRFASQGNINSAEQGKAKILIDNVAAAFQLPAAPKDLTQQREAIHKRLSTFLGRNYPEATLERIRTLVDRHIEASVDQDSGRNIAYFFGDAGLGKSSVARGIADALDLPVIELRFDEQNLEKIVGSGHGSSKFEYFLDEKLKLSQLSSKLLAPQDKPLIPTNAVLLINEVDSAVNANNPNATMIRSFLLNDLLDPDRKEFVLRDLLLPVDMSRFLIIMTGNKVLQDSNSQMGAAQRSAVNDRLDLIEFKSFTEEGIKSIAKRILEKTNYSPEFVDELAHEYFTLNIPSLRPLERHILRDYANCLKKEARGEAKCDFNYKAGLEKILENERILKEQVEAEALRKKQEAAFMKAD